MASRESVAAGVGLLIFDLVIWWLGAGGLVSLGWILGALGIVTFLGVLLLGFSTKETFEKDTVQLAIAASVLTVYFALSAILMFSGITPADPALASAIIGHFTTVVEVVVAFYVGSTTLGYAAAIWGTSKVKEGDRKELLGKLIGATPNVSARDENASSGAGANE